MLGVPPDLNLEFLAGAELQQVCLGLHQLQFHFHPTGSLSVEGSWEMCDSTGLKVDGSFESLDRPPYLLHRLLGHRVIGTEIVAPKSFALRFDSGDVLRIFDDFSSFESFQISPGDQIA